MKKILGVIVLALLLSGNAYAGINEPGITSIAGCDRGLKSVNKKFIKKHLKKLSKKNENSVLYASCDYENYSWAVNKGKDLEKLHKKTYKQCTKYSKKHTGKECYLYAVNDEIVWKYDKAKASTIAKTKIAEAKVLEEKNLKIDKKLGRFFEDQPDVSDDFQFHLIYFLDNKTKDKERDISGYIEKQMKKADDAFFKMTKNKQRFKFDYREDGKLDVTFVRMDRKARSGGWNVNYPDYYLTKNGFNNPKKMYLSFTDSASGDGGQMGPHHGYIFIGKAGSQYPQIIIHEMLHGLGFAMPCTKGVKDGAHMGSGILARGGGLQLPKALYGHDDSTCPDLKDSVYLTPTSDNPFDPLPIACALGQMKRGSPPGNFKIPARYIHKKLLKGRKNEWCTYNLHTYAKDDWFKKWKK